MRSRDGMSLKQLARKAFRAEPRIHKSTKECDTHKQCCFERTRCRDILSKYTETCVRIALGKQIDKDMQCEHDESTLWQPARQRRMANNSEEHVQSRENERDQHDNDTIRLQLTILWTQLSARERSSSSPQRV